MQRFFNFCLHPCMPDTTLNLMLKSPMVQLSSDLIRGVYTLYNVNMNTLEVETPTTLEYTNEKLVQLRNLSPVKLKCSAYMHNSMCQN